MNGFTDADWDQYLEDLNAYKLDDYLAIFQKYLDDFYGSSSANTDADADTSAEGEAE